ARVVWHDRHVVGLGHRRDLLQLADPAGPGHVRHHVVGQAPLEDRQEFPAGVQPLADADPHRHLVAHLRERVKALRRYRLFEPADAVRRQPVREPDGRRHVVHRVRVDQELDPRPDRLADAGDQLDAVLLGVGWARAVEVGDVPLRERGQERVGLDRPGAAAHLRHRALDRLGDRAPLREVHVERDGRADGSAEQVVDRSAERLAADVPQRDVDRADGGCRRAARADVGEGAEQPVPERFDVHWVLPDQQRLGLAQVGGDGAVRQPTRVAGDLAPTGQALVGVDLHEDVLLQVGAGVHAPGHRRALLLGRAIDDPGGDAGDLHRDSPWAPAHYPIPRAADAELKRSPAPERRYWYPHQHQARSLALSEPHAPTPAPSAAPLPATPRNVAAYLRAVRELMTEATTLRRSWIRQVGVLILDARAKPPEMVAPGAAHCGAEQRELFAGIQLRLSEMSVPRGCDVCQESFVAWLDKQVGACDLLVEIGRTSDLLTLKTVQR